MRRIKLWYYTVICQVVWFLDKHNLRENTWHWAEVKRAEIQAEIYAEFFNQP